MGSFAQIETTVFQHCHSTSHSRYHSFIHWKAFERDILTPPKICLYCCFVSFFFVFSCNLSISIAVPVPGPCFPSYLPEAVEEEPYRGLQRHALAPRPIPWALLQAVLVVALAAVAFPVRVHPWRWICWVAAVPRRPN